LERLDEFTVWKWLLMINGKRTKEWLILIMILELKLKERLAIWMGVNLTVQYYLVHLCLAVRFHHYHLDVEVEGSIHRLHVVLWRVAIVLAVDLHCVVIQGREQEHQCAEDVHIHIVHIVRGVDQDHPIPEVVVEVIRQEVDQEAVVEAEVVVAIEISMALTFIFFFYFFQLHDKIFFSCCLC